MSSTDEQWKKYAEKLEPYKYEIGSGILILMGLFYIVWIVYMIYRAFRVGIDVKEAGIDVKEAGIDVKEASIEMKTQLTTEFWKYVLTAIGLCFQYGVIASYIIGKIVTSVMVENGVMNVSTCDSEYAFNTTLKSGFIYYYTVTLFQVFSMVNASCMLSTFNLILMYLKCVYYKKKYNTQEIRNCAILIAFEFVFINIISIIGVGIPIALAILFVLILVKFIRFSLNCKEGYKVYRHRIDRNIRDGASESLIEHGDNLESECTHYGYIATVFCFGAGFYIAQLTFDPLATIVEASCTIFPDERYYIRILFHFMKLLVWGSWAMVIIIFVPFFLPYTFYYSCIVCCPTQILNFLSRASNCFRKPGPKVHHELTQPLINKVEKD
ncbi:hypothetical protein LOD99_4605 [Oopsacas minuta]|uniref:Uncharacterized protein n=1 Tax=Oopsacas minuta TaxID=111878 RepID=A0AAV7JUB7_9METZ|nr:hypothetical protein LOD99_4605 [Oopsacas minuta]